MAGRQGETTFGGAGAATYRPASLTSALGVQAKPVTTPAAQAQPSYMNATLQSLGVQPKATTPAAPTPTVGAGTTYAQQVTQKLLGTPAPAAAAPAAAPHPAAAAPASTGGGGTTWGGWGTAVQQGGGYSPSSVTGTPNWGSWQTSAPLYSTSNYVNPQTGRNWGTSPRLNMAIAEATGYTGNFDAASWNAYYNSLSPSLKAHVDALRSSYPANTTGGAGAGGGGGGGGGAATTPYATNPQYPNAPAPAAPTQYVAGTNVPQGGTDPNLVSGGAGVTATGAGGAGAGTAGGVGGSWIQQGAAPTGVGLPAGVTQVNPTFDAQSGQFTGYSPTAAQWGNAANMAAYYPTR